jgi:excisionase family DNA binding protein
MQETSEEIYTVEEVARKLKVTPTTISRRIRDGKLNAFRTNGNSGSYRIKASELDAFQHGTSPELATVQSA